MKITIEVNDLEMFAKAFNNAIAACGNIYYSLYIGCQVPSDFEGLKVLSEEELKARQRCLVDVYEQVVKIEQLKGRF